MLRLGETPGVVAPLGTDVKYTLWTATVSWSVHVIVVPDVTVMLAGLKFSPLPAPWGMVTLELPDAPDADEDWLEFVEAPVEVALEVQVLEADAAEDEVELLAAAVEEVPAAEVEDAAEVVELPDEALPVEALATAEELPVLVAAVVGAALEEEHVEELVDETALRVGVVRTTLAAV